MARYQVPDALRGLAALAIFVGFFLFLFGSPILFNPHEVDCDGHGMQPGQVCGPNALTGGGGDPYEVIAQENAVRRWIGYSGVVLVGWGALTLIIAALLGRRR